MPRLSMWECCTVTVTGSRSGFQSITHEWTWGRFIDKYTKGGSHLCGCDSLVSMAFLFLCEDRLSKLDRENKQNINVEWSSVDWFALECVWVFGLRGWSQGIAHFCVDSMIDTTLSQSKVVPNCFCFSLKSDGSFPLRLRVHYDLGMIMKWIESETADGESNFLESCTMCVLFIIAIYSQRINYICTFRSTIKELDSFCTGNMQKSLWDGKSIVNLNLHTFGVK